jgi:hypothetical protein
MLMEPQVPDHHDLDRIRKALRTLLTPAVVDTSLTDAQLDSFMDDTAIASELLHKEDAAWIEKLKFQVIRLQQLNRLIHAGASGAPAEKKDLLIWFTQQDPNRQLRINPSLLAASR